MDIHIRTDKEVAGLIDATSIQELPEGLSGAGLDPRGDGFRRNSQVRSDFFPGTDSVEIASDECHDCVSVQGQQISDLGEEDFRGYWLVHGAGESELSPFHRVVEAGVAADHEHLRSPFLASDLAQELHPIHFRHLEIEDDEIELLPLEAPQPLLGTAYPLNPEPGPRKHAPVVIENALVIVDRQNPSGVSLGAGWLLRWAHRGVR